MAENTADTLVLGIGNILMCDDGVGVHVIERMRRDCTGSDVEFLDGGTAGADLLDVIAGRKKVVVVDAMDAGLEPGTIAIFSPHNLSLENKPGISLHELGITETLRAAEMLKCRPEEVIIIGIQPQRVCSELGLSSEIEERLPAIIRAVSNVIG